jgi:hypothetical protein
MSGAGCADLRRYREGKRLTFGESVKAMCASCCCEFVDGRLDCGIRSCPLHPRMPYRAKQPSANNSPTATASPSNIASTGHGRGKKRP